MAAFSLTAVSRGFGCVSVGKGGTPDVRPLSLEEAEELDVARDGEYGEWEWEECDVE